MRAKISINNNIQIKIGIQDILAFGFGGIFILASLNLYYSSEIDTNYLLFHIFLSGTLIISLYDNKITQLFKISLSLIYLSVFWLFRNHIALEDISLIVSKLLVLLDTNLLVMILFGILLGLSILILFLYNNSLIHLCSFLILIFSVTSSLFSVFLLLAPNTIISSWTIGFFQCFLLTYVIFSFFNSLLLLVAHLIHIKIRPLKKREEEDFS